MCTCSESNSSFFFAEIVYKRVIFVSNLRICTFFHFPHLNAAIALDEIFQPSCSMHSVHGKSYQRVFFRLFTRYIMCTSIFVKDNNIILWVIICASEVSKHYLWSSTIKLLVVGHASRAC